MKASQPTREWLSIKEAAAYLSVSSSTIRRLRQSLDPCTRKPFLLSSRPAPNLILISTQSLDAHREAAQDLEFWDKRHLSRGMPRKKAARDRCSPASKGQSRKRCF